MKHLKMIAILTAFALGLTACAGVTAEDTTDNESIGTTGTDNLYDDLYSERDLEQSYDESEAYYIELTGGSVTIDEAGTYVISGNTDDGSVIIDVSNEDKVQLVLNGCSIASSTSAAIYVKNADKVFITTAEGSVNTLSNTTGFEADGDTDVNGVIFSNDDLTLNGLGTIIIESVHHGIVGKDDLTITGGTYEITSSEDALHANDILAIDGGEFTIDSGDDAVHCELDLVITGGTINIVSCVEGLEGTTVTVNDGDITVTASDDAVNAAGESGDTMTADASCYVTINGGSLNITTYGDGIDSNGDLTVTGGTVTISGPENGGNGSLDYAGNGSITGGSFIAAGMSGMEMNFTEAAQGSMLVSTGVQTAGTQITVTGSDGNEIMSFTPSTSYSCVLISSPELQTGETFTITAGVNSQEVTLEENIYGQTSGFGAGRGPGPDNGQPHERPDGFDGPPPEPMGQNN